MTVAPGRFTIRDPIELNFSEEISLARMRFATTVLGEQIQISCDFGTGSIAALPASGSRKMAEANEEAAPEGAPGRITIWAAHALSFKTIGTGSKKALAC